MYRLHSIFNPFGRLKGIVYTLLLTFDKETQCVLYSISHRHQKKTKLIDPNAFSLFFFFVKSDTLAQATLQWLFLFPQKKFNKKMKNDALC
jgi:hypothetical protein